jgi:hypothetical protein
MSPEFVWRAPVGRVLRPILLAYAGPRLHVWKRTACLAGAIALLALPVSVLAEHVEGGDPVTAVLVAPVVTTVVDPAYVWDGRLAASYSALVAVAPTHAWDPSLRAATVRNHFLLEHASQ